MKIKGMQLPPGMGLSEFLKKAKEGMQDDIYGALSNPTMQSEDMLPDRMAWLEELNTNLGFDTLPESAISQTDIRKLIDLATYGNLNKKVNSTVNLKDPVEAYDDPTLQALGSMVDEGEALNIPMWQTSQQEFHSDTQDLLDYLNNTFPSDRGSVWASMGSNILNNNTGEITSSPGYYNPDGTEPPAVASAELFNALTDEDLLKLLIKKKA